MKYLLLILLVGLLAMPAAADEEATKDAAKKAAPPPELGRVAWIRDHDAGFAEARRTEKPVFLFFQEVPG